MPSIHEHYRDRLIALSRPSAFSGVIGELVGDATGWIREYGRFTPRLSPADPVDAPYSRLVFARPDRKALVTVEVFDTRPSAHRFELVGRCAHIGWAGLTRFPSDARLSTLAGALDVTGDVSIVRYRPGRRCTFRVVSDAGDRYGKVFPDESGAAVHEAGVLLTASAARGEIEFAVAPPISWDARRRTLWQGTLGGTPAAPLLAGRDGATLAAEMGRAAATLTRASVRPTGRHLVFDQLARSRSYVTELAARVPALATRAAALVDAVEAVHRGRPVRAVPIHGAPHPNQWLLCDGPRPARTARPSLGLVDFDRFALGDPELDVATFLGELDFEEELGTSRAALGAAFVQGYESVAGRLDPVLAAAYRTHKRLAKALRSARAIRPDGDRRATVHFTRAEDALALGATR